MNGIPQVVNYIRLINWAWQNIPYLPGFKGMYMNLFLGIVDSINTNRWQETSIPYELLINKVGISKQVYLDGRQWLINNDLLNVELGKNGYQMAKFNIGIAVQKQTAIYTATDTATITAEDTSTNTGNDTAGSTATDTHYNKHKTDKPETDKRKTLNISFDQFWVLYDKRIGKIKAEKLWNQLSDSEREEAIIHVKKYVLATPDKQYRSNPETYLRNKKFNDEIISAESSGGAYKQVEPINEGETYSMWHPKMQL